MILVTGHKGFIATHLCKALNKNYIGIDLPTDICTMPFEQKVEGIIHLAAVSRVSTAAADPVECARTNIYGTTRLLEYARKVKAWFVFISSIEVENPCNLYAISKKAGEQICLYYRDNYKMKVAIIRLGNVYGKGDQPDRVIPTIHRKARAGEDIILNYPDMEMRPVPVTGVVKEIIKSCGDCYLRYCQGEPITLRKLTEQKVKQYKSKSRIL